MKELKLEISRLLKNLLGSRLTAIILFGSSIYMGRGEDVDLLIVVNHIDSLDEKLDLEEEIKCFLNRSFNYEVIFDAHVLSLNQFRENLRIGSFLSGLSLGYQIIYDRSNMIEEEILEMLKSLSKSRYIIVNKYGRWNLSKIAEIKLRIRETSRDEDLTNKVF
ncbi:MAG: hypothetical protein RMI88_03675 [Nitrososphaerota archaeon]|nr:hypothetical protein [Nitrososphaerota archaeon]